MVDRVSSEAARLAHAIEEALRAEATEERRVKEKAYLKSELVHLGTKVPTIRKITKRAVKHLETHAEVVAVADALWREPVHERRVAAVEVLSAHVRKLVADDIAVVGALASRVEDLGAGRRDRGGFGRSAGRDAS